MSATPKKSTERPWIMRTYSGHSSARASNALYRQNLAKGQTGLSVAFDLPTQTGYDPDHPLARGEVGKVGVPVSHLGDLRALFDGIPLETMNVSMTINATAPWLFALYLALAEERGVDRGTLTGTTQNDIIKEYLSRGTYIFPPEASMRLATDLVVFAVEHVPQWNPTNICSYHLQEAGATPVQELSYALCTAIGLLDAVRARGGNLAAAADGTASAFFSSVVGRISFFVNAGIRFVEEMCKLRAFVRLWDTLCRDRYGVTDAAARRFRYGVQVNSLGLTERQPENNIPRIVLEMLGVVLSKNARARAVQLPAWNEALGLPRPWDQQWSLRIQQIMAYETDLLEYADLFDGSPVVEARVALLCKEAWAEVEHVLGMGGVVPAVESAYLKSQLVASHAARLGAIERGEITVVGVNRFSEGEPSPLVQDATGGGASSSILTVDPAAEREQLDGLAAWRAGRDDAAVRAALAELERAVTGGENVLPASIACARAGVTTGEWGEVLRRVLGEYRAPSGVGLVSSAPTMRAAPGAVDEPDELERLRESVRALSHTLGRNAKVLIGKPGLDGHSNGAEQIALKARDAGFEVVYEGIRLTPSQIARSAVEEGVHLVGLSILSGSHGELVPEVVERLRQAGLGNVPVVIGGIIPDGDAERLRRAGVAKVYTPKDFVLGVIMRDFVELIRAAHGLS